MAEEKTSVGELARRRVVSQKVKKVTEGLFSNIFDFALYTLLLLPATSFGKPSTSKGVYQMFQEANALGEGINYQTFKNAIRKLKEKRFIERLKDWEEEKLATQEGIKRLKRILPFYDEKRFWDGNLYLVQYDIPVERNRTRDLLRDWFLRGLRAIQLQKSLYLVFFNPQKLIQKFIEGKSGFEGNILVSKLARDGFLGEERIEDLLWQKSGLEGLNLEYENFIDKYKKKNKVYPSEIHTEYFSLLKKDPQIPFELLPSHYLGDEAYLLFLRHIKHTLFHKYMLEK